MDIFIFDEICISTLDNVKRMGALIGASSAPSLEDSLCHGSRPDPWEQRRGRKGLREYAQLPRLHSRWSFSHGSKPAFLKSFFPALRRL